MSQVDGSLVFDTLMDLTGFNNGIKKIQDSSEKASKSSEKVGEKTSETAEDIMNSADIATMAIKALIASLERAERTFKKIYSISKSVHSAIASGIGSISETAGKFTLKQFIGDWEKDSSAIKKVLIAAASAFSLYKLFDFSKESVELGSDLAEVQNVVDVAFGKMKYKMEDFSKTSIEKFGLSQLAAKRTGSSYMAMAKGIGVASETASDMSISLTALSADMASFYNISQDEARIALSSVFTGETETLKRYGILITEINLQEYARQQGISKSISKMTQQEKVLLRYNYIMNATKLAQGDFVRTQDNWANQIRVLQFRWQSLQATMGKGMINALTPALTLLNTLIARMQTAAEWFTSLMTAIFGDASGSTGAATEALNTADDSAEKLADNSSEAAKAIGDITDEAEKLQNNLSAFDELNVMSINNTSNDTVASSVDEAIAASDIISDTVTNTAQETVDNFLSSAFIKSIIAAVKAGNWYLVGKIIGGEITSALSKIPWSSIKKKTADIAEKICDFLNGSIAGVEWDTIGITIAEGLNTAIIFLDTLLSDILWGNLGEAIATGLNSFVETFDAEKYGKLVADRINAIFTFLGGFTFSFHWDKLGKKIAQTLYSYFSNLKLTEDASGNSIPKTIAEILNGLVQAGIELFTYTDPDTGENIWAIIGRKLGEGFKEFVKNFSVQDAVKLVKNAIGAFIQLVYNAFKGSGTSFKELGKDVAKGLNDWFDDTEWWSSAGTMINEIFNDIIDFISGVIMETDPVKLGDAIQTLFSKINYGDIFKRVWYLVQTAALKAITAGIASTGSDFLMNWWSAWLNDSLIGKGAPDYVKNILGNYEEKSEYDKPHKSNPGSDMGEELAEGVVTGYNTTIDKQSVSMKTNTVAATQTSLDGARSTIESDTSVPHAMSVKSKEGQTAMIGGFNQLTIKGHFSQVWESIKSIFSNVGTWFEEKFGGAWKKVKSIFSDGSGVSSIKTSVENVFKKLLNGLIDGLNSALSTPFDSLNSALDTLREFSIAGHKPFNWIPYIDAPQIPRLATGTVVPANYGEYMAILGDNKREPEVVSPLSTMKQALAEVMAEVGGGQGGGDINITIELDGDVLARKTVKWNDNYKKTHGKTAFA